jgi:hypothetical protein
VPKTSSPQQSFKDAIRAHFFSPFPMPAHIVNRVMKTNAGRDGADLDLVRLLRDLRSLISEREQEPRSQSSVGSSPQSSPRLTRDGWHDACDQDQYWRTIRKLKQTAPRAGYTGNSTQGNGGWQPVPWADKLPAERKKQSAYTKETKRRRKSCFSRRSGDEIGEAMCSWSCIQRGRRAGGLLLSGRARKWLSRARSYCLWKWAFRFISVVVPHLETVP